MDETELQKILVELMEDEDAAGILMSALSEATLAAGLDPEAHVELMSEVVDLASAEIHAARATRN